jgi:quercetin dioxygenase-like cupin family protein
MNKTSAASPKATSGKSPVIDSNTLPRAEVWGETDQAVSWQGAFALYGGEGGATASSTIVYEVEPGSGSAGHTDATEETQYIIAGRGKLYLEDGSTHDVGPGSVFVIPDAGAPRSRKNRQGDLARRGLLRRGDVHAGFDQVMLPPKSHILGTPNRSG